MGEKHRPTAGRGRQMEGKKETDDLSGGVGEVETWGGNQSKCTANKGTLQVPRKRQPFVAATPQKKEYMHNLPNGVVGGEKKAKGGPE